MKDPKKLVLSLLIIGVMTVSIIFNVASVENTHILITEVCYDPPGTESQEEWIELYNPTNNPVNIKDWSLSDNVGTNTLPDVTIPSGGYFIFARSSSGFFNVYNFYPDSDDMTLALGNSGDKLSLKDSSGVEVDFVAWENYVSGWGVKANNGETIRRISDTHDRPIDTDTVNDWENSGSLGDPGAGYGALSDTTAPEVNILNPSDGAIVSGTINISFSASDDNGISSTAIIIDGITKKTDSYWYLWDTTTEDDGSHVIRCEATDPSNNVGYSEVTVTIDNNQFIAPAKVYFTDPLAGLPWMDKPLLQEGNISSALVSLIDSANTTIDAALYHLSWQPIIDALIRANNSRKVNVNIACHGDNIDEFQDLIDAGISVHAVNTYNIMHDKFFIVDNKLVWTGSYNPTITGTIHNANDGIEINSPDLAQIFESEFEQLYAGLYGSHKTDNNNEITKAGDVTVEAYFSPTDNTRDRLIGLIDSTNVSLYISMFYLTDNSVYDAIVRAHNRGVMVKAVLDYRGWFNSYSEADDLIALGLGVIDANPGVYHHKFAVFDGKIVWTGSTNWSGSGFDDNDENSIVIHSTTIAAHYIARTNEYYQDAVNYDNSPTQAPRIVTKHYSSWDGANLVTWRPHMEGNVANDLIKTYLVWRWNETTEGYDFLSTVDPATGYYADYNVKNGTTYYYVVSSIAKGGYSMTTCSAEFAQVGIGGEQPAIYPPRNYYSNFGNDSSAPTVRVIAPKDGETVEGWVTVSIKANDSSYLDKWAIYIDGQLMSNDSLYNWDTTEFSQGTHTILAKVKDVFGNWGESSISVTVDNSGYIKPSLTGYDEIKIMTYNIEASGENPDYVKVLKEEDPDIFVMVETGNFDDWGNSSINDLIVELNLYFDNEAPYSFSLTQGIGSKYSGVAIISRFTIVRAQQIGIVTLDDGTRYDVSHDFLDALVKVGTGEIHFIGAHLKARSGTSNEIKREKAQEGILNYIDGLNSSIPVIYLGDLNSFSPEDTGDLAPHGDLGYGPVSMIINVSDTHASEDYNFTDVFRTLNPNDPGYSYPHEPYESRIDFIFVSSLLQDSIYNSTCGDTPSASTGSDHYPVDVFLNVTYWKPIDNVAPSKVTGLNVTAVSSTQINLYWEPNKESDLAYYKIYRNGVLLTQVNDNNYNDTDLTPNTQYTYEISAVDTSGNEGPRSDPSEATTFVDPKSQIFISEVFYDTPGSDAVEEYVELYNNGTEAVDLSGWRLSDNTGTFIVPDGTILKSKDYLIIARNADGFYKLFGFYPDLSGLKLSLSNSGDELTLRDNNLVEKDFVAWENYVNGWNIAAPTGKSIQRIPVSVDTNTVNDWIVADPTPTVRSK